jgi:hypothetical protein
VILCDERQLFWASDQFCAYAQKESRAGSSFMCIGGMLHTLRWRLSTWMENEWGKEGRACAVDLLSARLLVWRLGFFVPELWNDWCRAALDSLEDFWSWGF